MWSIIEKQNFNKYIEQYPDVSNLGDEICLFEKGNNIFLPKFTYFTHPSPLINTVTDPDFVMKDIDIIFTKELWSDQIQMISPLLKQYNLNGTMVGTLKARPGAGKTVMGIYLITVLKKVSLIMLNNTALIDQWVQTILNFTDCTIDDIGWIQGNKFDVENKKIIIGMVQTFCSKIQKEELPQFYANVRDSGIGCVLFDECHHTTSGPKYALSSLVLNTNNIIGLSATPFHIGLQHFLMTNTVGYIVSDTYNYEIKPTVNIIKFSSNMDQKVIKSIYRVNDLIKQRAKYNAIITNSPDYIELLVKLNQKLLQKNHRIINIVFTKKQVETISDALTNNNVKNIQFYSEQRELNKTEDNCLVATYKFAGEGFDYKELSALIIATPLSGRKSLIQVIGRILRTADNKTSPEVYILVDKGFGNVFVRDIPKISKVISDEFGISCNIADI